MRISTVTTTERHTFDTLLSPEEHQALLDDGFLYDRLSRQYRRSKTVTTASGEAEAAQPTSKKKSA
jgi:hypothetical protein